MKKRKIHKQKVLIAVILAAVCVGVLVGAFVLTRESASEFVPVSSSASASESGEWVEPGILPVTADENKKAPGIEEDSEAGSEETVSKLTDTDRPKPAKPEAPDMGENINDPDNPPSYTPEQTNPSGNPGPAPGGQNGSGQIYDPVFGWITPGAGQGDVADGDGDPDKQLGDM